MNAADKPTYWHELGECSPPEHVAMLRSKNYRWVLLRCTRCGVERKRRKTRHDPSQPCRCVNLETQRKKMGAWMKWATGDKLF